MVLLQVIRRTSRTKGKARPDRGRQPNKVESQTGFKIRPQPLGKELEKDAQVWEIYVQETDRLDAELVKEWNDSLDVLLIFAALFSAITTALVIESGRQLQPDPTEESMQTLLVISQTLIAISNGEKVQAVAEPNALTSFSPTGKSVVVNALWFTSLSLSVVVSLVAMLSKSWCNAFLSNRTGGQYDQGRRRQKKWTGIESWGMPALFVYLPTLMHLALLLFAIGLVLYLWDINIKVASPVLGLTVALVLLYGLATMLPLVYDDCPYSTPLSKPFRQLLPFYKKPWIKALWGRMQLKWSDVWKNVRQSTPIVHISKYIERNKTIQHISKYTLKSWARLRAALTRRPEEGGQLVERQPHETPMDEVTTHMLCWLLTHCEDKRYVDLTLQAISGACCGLPRTPLVECDALGLIAWRLMDCFDYDGTTIRLNERGSINSAVLYARAMNWLVINEGKKGLPFDEWSVGSGTPYELYMEAEPNRTLYNLYDYFSYYLFMSTRTGLGKTGASTIAVLNSVIMPSSHYIVDGAIVPYGWTHDQLWRDRLSFDPSEAMDLNVRLIQNYVNQVSPLPAAVLVALLEVVPHAMIESLLDANPVYRRQWLLAFLQLVKDPAYALPEIQHALGLILTVAAILVHPYPGWTRPATTPEGRKARAMQVYVYYTNRRYTNWSDLIRFGLKELLRPSVADSLGLNYADMVMVESARAKIEPTVRSISIHTLPPGTTDDEGLGYILLKHIESAVAMEDRLSDPAFIQLLHTLGLSAKIGVFHKDFKTLIRLICTVQHTVLRRACVQLSQSAQNMMFLGAVWLFELSFGAEDVYIAPDIMTYIWKMTKRLVWEANQNPDGGLAAMLAPFLASSGFASGPNLPANPQNIFDTGLADVWYPLLDKMVGHKSTAVKVGASRILQEMKSACNRGLEGTVPRTVELQDGRTWLEIVQELQDRRTRSARDID